jgi:hypothetical protein
MKELNKIQTFVFLAGAVLMAVGAGLYVLQIDAGPYLFCLGALAFVSMQLLQRYEGSNFTIRRLRRIMILSDVLFLIAGVLMLANQGNVLHLDQWIYIKYVRNNWVVTLLVAAILQLYTTHRIDSELAKEAKKL